MFPVLVRRNFSLSSVRNLSSASGASRKLSSTQGETRGWLFVDSVLPIQFGSWDLRYYIGVFRSEILLSRLQSILSSVTTHNFQLVSLEPHQKDGGVYVAFTYSGNGPALDNILYDLREVVAKKGGCPNWIGLKGGNVWLVRGSPWREDMSRFASPIVRLAFDGPDIQEEALYTLLRPYGRIRDITPPNPVPSGTLRSSTITFHRINSATIARNVVHGLTFDSGTLIRAIYEQPIHAHVIRKWLSEHPKIVLPVIAFLLGTLTYTIFDPIRAWMVEAKVMDWFDYRQSKLTKWLFSQTLDRFFSSSPSSPFLRGPPISGQGEDAWKERQEAEGNLKAYLTDMPSTVAFLHGPRGSGKSRMLSRILQETDRKSLTIDCSELHKANSEASLVSRLAQQTGYWPVFSFLNSMINIIDLASVGVIGQKTGLSSNLTDQIQQILSVVTTGLNSVSSRRRAEIQRRIKREQSKSSDKTAESLRRFRILRGTWHDGRIDCVSGNGVMSELGIGDEKMDDEMDGIGEKVQTVAKEANMEEGERERKQRSEEEVQAVGSLPIVVLKDFTSKGGKEELLGVLAGWAAELAENHVAHVIVISDNRENSKRLAKSLPSKPLNSIALYDADPTSALSFVKQKLRDTDVNLEYSAEQTAYVERLGGRASDLDSLIHKVRSGQKVEEAVEDIITRGVGELRKNAFGDDVEDAKSLAWSREQAWAVLKLLSVQEEIPYQAVLQDFPFKGDEIPLRSMEHAELITIGTYNGRPSTIRPGRPVFKYVFERLVQDSIFQATEDLCFNEKVIASAENTVRSCEQELMTLKELPPDSNRFWRKSASETRTEYLFEKMSAAVEKIATLEKKNVDLRKVLAKGG